MKKIISLLSIVMCFLFVHSASAMMPEKAKKGEPVKVNKEEFQKYIYNFDKNPDAWKYEGTVPCIIDFYADWCAPCRKLSPILDNIAKEYKGQVIIYKVDTESQRELAAYFGIRSLPTILFVPAKGNPQATMGLMSEDELKRAIEKVLEVKPPQSGKKI